MQKESFSVYVWEWMEDIADRLPAWEQLGAARVYLTFWHPFEKLAQIARLIES